jgi:Winged helix-turn helix
VATHLAFLARIVQEGPIPPVHGVVRWRACDLIMRVHEEFGISVSDDTIYRALKDLDFSHLSARPKAYKQDAEAVETFKLLYTCGGSPREARARHTGRSVVPARNAGRADEQAHIRLGSEGLTSPCRARSAHPVDLPVRCSLPRPRSRCSPRATGLQQRSHAASSRRDHHQGLHRVPMPFSFSIKPAGTAPRNFGFRPTSPYCRCRRVYPSSTAKRTSGSSCGRTGSQTAFSNHSTTSSITAATPGTHLSANLARSCPSPDATGRPPVTHCENWY